MRPVVAALVLVAATWEAYVAVTGISPIVLPPPSRVVAALWEFREDALRHGATTLLEALLGLAVSLGLAVGLAIAMDRVAAIRGAIEPLLVGSQSIPVVAIAPLLVLWLGFGIESKVLVIVLVTFFPIVIGLLDGFARTPADGTDLLRSLGAGRDQEFWKLRWPGALPSLFTGLRIAATYAIVAAVFGEYVGAVAGLGIWMQVSQNAFRTDLVLAAVLVTAALSVGLYLAVGLVERAVVPWHGAARRALRDGAQ
jgi:ABC-type nitrate/sulfonate/bicarbonate transport system permease component